MPENFVFSEGPRYNRCKDVRVVQGSKYEVSRLACQDTIPWHVDVVVSKMATPNGHMSFPGLQHQLALVVILKSRASFSVI